MNNGIECLTSPVLSSVPHGFLGRQGGVSQGVYSGLNVGFGSDDEREAITENRRLAINTVLPCATLVTVNQIHSTTAVIVDAPAPADHRAHADALVTNRPGLLLGIMTADCVPVLFADLEAGVVAAAHAGWKGALGGVTDETILQMETIGADRNRICCAVGPCISRASYEVKLDFRDRFISAAQGNERFFTDGRPGHAHFDIEAYVIARLANAGVKQIEAAGQDTCSQPDRFFSYRRSCLQRETGYGRQISLIGLSPV